jgi:two-component system, NarL family, nitrate/nitrite sensor histidine kinase NarX
MRPRRTLAFKLVATGMAFLWVALGSIALTLWVTWQLEGGAAAVNEAGRMRMLTYRMALEAAVGSRAELPALVASMDATLDLLRDGDPSRPLFVPKGTGSGDALATLRTQWDTLRGQLVDVSGSVPLEASRTFVEQVDNFVSLIEHELSHWTAVLRAFQLTMVALAIASAVILLYAAYLMVLEPLRRLGAGLASIRGGDFSVRVEAASTVEFHELAEGFNAMAEHLQEMYRDLEAKVREKTERLEDKRRRLATLYDMSAFVARAESLDELARGFVARLRVLLGADAVAVRWSDEANERYLLLAQEGLPGALARDEQCLNTASCHCGQPAPRAHTRVIPVRADEPGRSRCAQAGFKTLLSVPVSLHQRVLGEVDLLFRDARTVNADERSLVEVLASHLAGGIEGLRAAAAAKEAAVAQERTLLAQELHDSIAQSLAFMKIQVGLLRESLRRGDQTAATRTIGELEAGVKESYGDVRELLLHFRTRTQGEDIGLALRSTVQKFEHQTGLPVTLEMQGHGVPLPTDVQVQVLHIVQEALSNVRKHASARNVDLRVQQTPQWRFEVADDGAGFDAAADAGESHVGLRIMRERAARIGAHVEVDSAPGAGTRVVITVPSPMDAARENEDEHAAAAASR